MILSEKFQLLFDLWERRGILSDEEFHTAELFVRDVQDSYLSFLGRIRLTLRMYTSALSLDGQCLR